MTYTLGKEADQYKVSEQEKGRKVMDFNEILKICLLAVASRYPESVVDVNEILLGHHNFWTDACPPLQLLELLQIRAPELLRAPARLVMNQHESVIYLVEQSQETPAFWIYCGGRTPSQRRERQLQAVSWS